MPNKSFQEKLLSHQFTLTGEIAPPKGSDLSKTIERAKMMAEVVDAINITDNQRAVMRMSSLAVAAKLAQHHCNPILQMTCRDRNRLALQSDLLGANALGVRNILALTGDPVTAGTQPESKAVFDLSSTKLIETAMSLNQGKDLVGNDILPPTQLFVGAVVNPNANKLTAQVRWLEQKVKAGAQFIQTQAIYDVERFKAFLTATTHIRVPILAGVLILKNAAMAKFLQDHVPGIFLPQTLINRLEQATDQHVEGYRITLELAEQLKPLAAGIHLMSVGQERTLTELAIDLAKRWQ